MKLSLRTLILFSFSIVALLAGAGTKFTLLTDIHVTPGNENERQLGLAIEEINANDSKFVILSGDLTNEGSDEQLYNVKRILDGLEKPIYVIPGNHENNWSQSASKTFMDIWGDDKFVFESDSIIFIGINCGPYMKMGDGHIKQEDLLWLKHELSQRCTPGKRVISINHYPIKEDIDNWQDYVSAIQDYPTILQIGGHYHTYEKYKGGDIDAVLCRALDMTRVQDGYGYTNFEVGTDTISIYDKAIGKPQILKYAVPIKATHKRYKPIPSDPELAKLPTNAEITCIYRDNASIFTRLAVDSKTIYFGNSLGEIKAIEKATGKLLWTGKTKAPLFSRPAVTSKYLIIPTSDKRIIWSDKKTGRIIRENASEGPYVADGLVIGNRLYQGGYKKFECWNVNTGNISWRYDSIDNYCQAAPVVDNHDVIFGAWDTYLRCLDAKTGHLKWKWNNGSMANMLGPGNCVPVITKDRVFIVAPDRYMTVLDRQTGHVIWRSNFDGKYRVRESLGVSENKRYVYAKTMDGQLIAIDSRIDKPEIAFVVDAQFGYEHAPCIVFEKEGVIYMGSRRGILAAIDARTFKLLWRYQLGTSEFNGFEADHDGNVYTSLIDGSIWKISKKK